MEIVKDLGEFARDFMGVPQEAPISKNSWIGIIQINLMSPLTFTKMENHVKSHGKPCEILWFIGLLTPWPDEEVEAYKGEKLCSRP